MTNTGRTKYKNNWQKEHVDRINLTVPKGQKASIQAHAAAHEESITAFIQRAIEEAMERDCLFADRKDDFIEHANTYHTSIGDQEEFKRLVIAFDALESVIPDIERIYFSELSQPKKRRANKVITVRGDSEQSE